MRRECVSASVDIKPKQTNYYPLTLNPHPLTDLLKLSNFAWEKCLGQRIVDRRCLSCNAIVQYRCQLIHVLQEKTIKGVTIIHCTITYNNFPTPSVGLSVYKRVQQKSVYDDEREMNGLKSCVT